MSLKNLSVSGLKQSAAADFADLVVFVLLVSSFGGVANSFLLFFLLNTFLREIVLNTKFATPALSALPSRNFGIAHTLSMIGVNVPTTFSKNLSRVPSALASASLDDLWNPLVLQRVTCLLDSGDKDNISACIGGWEGGAKRKRCYMY